MSELPVLERAVWAPEPVRTGPVVIVVMDGVGIGRRDRADAVFAARTPNLDRLAALPLSRTLRAHGTAVGLPGDGDMGNSEVGHNAIGAGRIFDQGAKRVAQAVEDGSLFRNEVWDALMQRCASGGKTLHFIGLLSDGNVHSHQNHLHALLDHAAHAGVSHARVHALLDGRDVPETSADIYIDRLEAHLSALQKAGHDYRVASGGGRMQVTMDRYGADWGVVERGYRAHVHGEGRPFRSATQALQTLREEEPGVIDQYLGAFVITDDSGVPIGPIRNGDAVVLFNFRGDRMVELYEALSAAELPHFDRTGAAGEPHPELLIAGMTLYDGDLGWPAHYLVTPPLIRGVLGEYLTGTGLQQFACAETQKFGHVTYFWNGNRSECFDPGQETWVEVPSDRVPFDQRPWMKAAEVTDKVLEALASERYAFLRTNLANGDMVGHTGDFEATVVSVEAVDLALGRLMKACERHGAALVVTGDHGNADDMYERDKAGQILVDLKTGRPKSRTSHSLNPVPLYIQDPAIARFAPAEVEGAGLGNIASTLLTLMGYDTPEGYLPSVITPVARR